MGSPIPPVRPVSTGKGSSLNAALCAGSVAAALLVASVLASSPAQAQVCPGYVVHAVRTDVAVTAVPIVAASTTADYFVLYATHGVDATTVEYPVAVALGRDGTTTLSENVAALPPERYRVEKYSIDYPADVDGDCIDDITELADPASMNPVNPAEKLHLPDRFAVIPDHQTYEALAYVGPDGGEHVKYVIAGFDTGRPSVYFQDAKRFPLHTLLSLNPPFWRVGGCWSLAVGVWEGWERVFGSRRARFAAVWAAAGVGSGVSAVSGRVEPVGGLVCRGAGAGLAELGQGADVGEGGVEGDRPGPAGGEAQDGASGVVDEASG